MLMLGLMALLPSACATPGFKPVCPTLYDYSAETQARAADDYDALPADSPLRRLMDDYGAVRAEIRACMSR